MKLAELKKEIFSLKKFIFAAFLIFFLSAVNGYFFAKTSPPEAGLILQELEERLAPLIEMAPLGQFLFVLLNNGIIAFLAIVLGLVFGIFPFLVLLSNGNLLGLMAFLTKSELSWQIFLAAILPHGIIEIPAIILACAIGLKLGQTVFKKVFKKQADIKKELNFALIFFLKVLFPFLALAAAVEIFLVSRFLL